MPPKGKPAPPSPPSSSSGSYATSSDEEDHQQTQPSPLSPKKVGPTKSPAAAANGGSDSDDSDSHSGSSDESEEAFDDSDSPPKPAAVSKPNVGTPKGRPSPVDKPKPSPAFESIAEKRKRQEAEEDAAAKGPSAKKLFQRVWTEEDEIAVLKGMIDFQAKHGGADPASATDAFYEFVRRGLHVEFTKSQLSDKMRRLRKKYETNLRRGKNGADPSFVKSHEQAAFELSKKLWEGKKTVISTSEGRANDNGSDNMMAVNVGVAGVSPEATGATVYPRLREAISLLEGEGSNLLTGSLSRVIELLNPAKAKALEDQWNKHFMVGVKYMLERAELKRDLLKSISKALASE